MLEFQADSAVMFYSGNDLKVASENKSDDIMATGPVAAVYLRGDIVMTEGERTIRAKELFYKFLAEGMPVGIFNKRYYAHTDNIDEWFRARTQDTVPEINDDIK